jgi:hypothetical protein
MKICDLMCDQRLAAMGIHQTEFVNNVGENELFVACLTAGAALG